MTETDKTAQERERFEAWWIENRNPIDPSPFPKHFSWAAWQARAALNTGTAPQPPASAVDAADRCPICHEPIHPGDFERGAEAMRKTFLFASRRALLASGLDRHASIIADDAITAAIIALPLPKKEG
jgi:hypothetical protein